MQNYNNKKLVRPNQQENDMKWRFKHAKIVCCNHGKHRERAKGIRPNQSVFACDRPFFFWGVFIPKLEKFTITALNNEHKITHYMQST
jgi:hypothetical protein